MIMIPLKNQLPKSTSNKVLIALAILIIGLIITFLATYYTYIYIEKRTDKEFSLVCNEIISKMGVRLHAHAQLLRSSAAYFETSDTITRQDWKEFIENSRIKNNLPGIQGVGFSYIVPKSQLQQHVQNIRNENKLDTILGRYNIKPIIEREIYTSIIYLEPFDFRNIRAFGYDMFSEPVRRKAMEQARDFDIAALSGKVLLVQETDKDLQAGTLMYVPVYKKNKPTKTVEERRTAIFGWVYSPYRMDDLMKGILGRWGTNSEARIHLKIYDNANLIEKALLFDSHIEQSQEQANQKNRNVIESIVFNEKVWTLHFKQSNSLISLFSYNVLLVFISGVIISFLLSLLTLSMLKAKLRGLIFKKLNSDLTETQNQFIKAYEQAQESDRLKSAFLANMSHEIRTPMNGILGFSELLKAPHLSGDQQQKYIGIIEKSGKRMLNIINDIVDISKIESGLMKLDIEKSNINEQIEYIYTFFKPEVEAKGMQLLFKNTLSAKEAIIKTDREKLFAILTNLVKNAIKYSNEGLIEIGYVLKVCEESVNHSQIKELEFYIKDTGIGIPKDRQEAVFERFIQSDISNYNANQGAGLGLSITKAYIEMLGGKIWVESEEGIGSTFYFTLPYNVELKEKNSTKEIEVTNNAETHVKNLKILIAEDDETSEMLLSLNVSKFSNEIITAKTGEEAVEIYHNNPDIDLILMDIRMPGMNGYEATRQIRQHNKEVIIIAQTAFGLSGDEQKALDAGCNNYIAKPIHKAVLEALIQKYFQ